MRENAKQQGSAEYVILSDVHLTELVFESEPGWWEHKRFETRQDPALCTFMRSLQRQRPAAFDRTVLIFNGDTFDFDAVFSGPEDAVVPKEGLPADVPGSVFKMRRILAHHEEWVRELAGFLALGNEVVFVMGNHDRELSFPEVREVLVQTVSSVAPAGTAALVAERLSFEPWFYHVPGLLYVEHGQQYDSTCSYRDILYPMIQPDARHALELDMSFGSIAARKVLCRVGTINPYNDESFLMSLGGYARHMMRYYFPKKGFVRHYFMGTVTAVLDARSARRRALRRPTDTTQMYKEYAKRHQVDAGFLSLLKRLGSTPIADRPRHLIHEMWWDRFLALLILFSLLGVGIANASTVAHGLALIALLPLFILVLRTMGRGSMALQERGRWGLVAEEIAGHLDVAVVAFGHSHRPERRALVGGGYYFNLGSWAPICDADRETTFERARRFLVVRPSQYGVHTAFQRWAEGETLRY